MEEEWRDVAGCLGYQVSNKGRIRSLSRSVPNGRGGNRKVNGRVLKPNKVLNPSDGTLNHLSVTLGRKRQSVHRIVLKAFKGPCPQGCIGCRDDDDPSNNETTNLRWDTSLANAADKIRNSGKKRSEFRTNLTGFQFISAYLSGISGLI